MPKEHGRYAFLRIAIIALAFYPRITGPESLVSMQPESVKERMIPTARPLKQYELRQQHCGARK